MAMQLDNSVFRRYNLPSLFNLQSEKFIFLLKFRVKILFCKYYFSPFNTFMRKGKDLEPDPDLYLWLMDLDPGGHKHPDLDPNTGSRVLRRPFQFLEFNDGVVV